MSGLGLGSVRCYGKGKCRVMIGVMVTLVLVL